MDRRWQWLVASVWNGLNVCALTDEALDGLWEYPSHLVEIGNKNFQLMVKEVEDALITPQHKLRFHLSLLAYIE
jgi:predicted restriction endonuclease